MDNNALLKALMAVAPVVGLTVGDENDRSTWLIKFDPSVEVTDAQRIAAAKVLNTYTDAAPSTQLNFLAFMTLFTSAEQAAIVGSTDPRIKLFCLMAAGSSYIDLTDERVIGGTQLLESLHLIGTGRAAQVIAGQAAPTNT